MESQLVVASGCSSEEQSKFKELLPLRHASFGINDAELEETDLVEYAIDTGNVKPVKTFPRRLPYVLKKELEEEFHMHLAIGCIEPSTSPYVSGLALVRKNDGSLRVHLVELFMTELKNSWQKCSRRLHT